MPATHRPEEQVVREEPLHAGATSTRRDLTERTEDGVSLTITYTLLRHVRSMCFLRNFAQWLVQNPLATATVLYMTGIMGVLVYTISRYEISMSLVGV